MTNIIVVFPKIEDAKSIKNVLVRNGFSAMAACTTGAQAIGLAEDYTNGIVICGYKLIDMLYSELLDCLPEGMQMLLMASNAYLGEVNLKGAGRDIVCGSSLYVYYHGMDYAAQLQAVKELYEAPSEALLAQWGIDYVMISGWERSDYAVDEAFYAQRYPVWYQNGSYTIYQITGAS